jgi:hypothetical protein
VVSQTAVSFGCAGDTVIGATREALEYGQAPHTIWTVAWFDVTVTGEVICTCAQ